MLSVRKRRRVMLHTLAHLQPESVTRHHQNQSLGNSQITSAHVANVGYVGKHSRHVGLLRLSPLGNVGSVRILFPVSRFQFELVLTIRARRSIHAKKRIEPQRTVLDTGMCSTSTPAMHDSTALSQFSAISQLRLASSSYSQNTASNTRARVNKQKEQGLSCCLKHFCEDRFH